MERFHRIVSFMKEVEKLKLVTRIVYLSDQKTLEDDTQHTWHMIMLLMCIKDELGVEFDMLKTIKMIMIHDLGEIYVGDCFIAFDKDAKKQKDEREKESLDRVLSLLPDDLREEFTGLVDEYILRQSIESKIAKALDQIQYSVQYLSNGGLYKGKYTEFEWCAEKDYDYGKHKVSFNDYLHDLFKHLVEESRQHD